MATKTFFGFESHLTSKGLTEAIALQHGPGPLFGYAGFELTTNDITLRPAHNTVQDSQLSEFSNKFGKMINDRFAAKRVHIKDLNSFGNFGIITKDGYIEISDDETILVPISNNRGLNPEVIIVAKHTYSEDVNIEIPVVYEAYWSQSSVRFFDLYKKSIDYNYPTSFEDRSVSDDIDSNASPLSDTSLSFDSLEKSAFAACGISTEDYNSYTLVGIYGNGNNRMNNSELQKFIILPYEGKFPMAVDYNYSEQSFLKDLMRHVYKVFDGIGNKTFRQYLIDLLSESDKEKNEVQVTIPIGTIVMWYGSTQNIPYGWEICDGTASVHNPSILKPDLMGRFPIGLSQSDTEYTRPGSKGGNNQLTLELNNIPQHAHVYTADAESAGKFGSVETGFPNVYSGSTEKVNGTAGAAGDQGIAQAYLTSKVGGNKPIDNRPAYTVVCFIIKTLA